MKIRIYCEGETERGLEALLTPVRQELREKELGLTIGYFSGNNKLLRKIGAATRDAIEEGSPGVFCIIDLFKVNHAFTEGMITALGDRNWVTMDVDQQVEWLKTHMRTRCIDRRYHNKFYPHVAVHEIEALIFADPDKIKQRLKIKLIGNYNQPERIDHDNPPSRQLNELFRIHTKNKSYKKTTDGVNFLRDIDFNLVCEKCPNFAAFVDDLRSIEPQ